MPTRVMVALRHELIHCGKDRQELRCKVDANIARFVSRPGRRLGVYYQGAPRTGSRPPGPVDQVSSIFAA